VLLYLNTLLAVKFMSEYFIHTIREVSILKC